MSKTTTTRTIEDLVDLAVDLGIAHGTAARGLGLDSQARQELATSKATLVAEHKRILGAAQRIAGIISTATAR